jgi:hypothetical protein
MSACQWSILPTYYVKLLRQYSFAKRSSNLKSKNKKALRETFVRKSRALNVGENDSWLTIDNYKRKNFKVFNALKAQSQWFPNFFTSRTLKDRILFRRSQIFATDYFRPQNDTYGRAIF